MEQLFPVGNYNENPKSIDVEYFDDSTTSKSTLQSSDSGISVTSEISSCGSSEDSDRSSITDNESHSQEQTSITFLKTLLPWMQKATSKVLPRTPLRVVDKVGGTLALIQYPRPPNFPAKSPTEDRFHRKQYQVILQDARKREMREACARQLQHQEQLRREERLAIDSSIWHTEILPQFEILKNTKRVRELWWCGLPSSIRGKIWKLGISNDLNIKHEQYDIYLERICANRANESLDAIRLDVSRTFPNLRVFQEGGPLFEALQSVLAVYTVYRSDIGYVQGMSFIGAVLTLNMSPNDAFICFANLLNNPCHRAAFTLNQKQMNVYYKVFTNALANKIPKVHLHFCTTGLSPDFYLLDWLYTIFAKAMPLDVACRVWDIFIRDGDEFLFRTALGILRMYQDDLLRMDFIRCAQFLTKLPENMQASILFDNIGQMTSNVGVCTFHEMIDRLS